MHVLRTPDERFLNLPGYNYAPHHAQELPGFEELRMHFVDEGKRDARHTFLCLHGQPTWGHAFGTLSKGARCEEIITRSRLG